MEKLLQEIFGHTFLSAHTVQRVPKYLWMQHWKCRFFYVGQTGDQLHVRFNCHRSAVKCNPYRCELPGHFGDHGCDFNEDLRFSFRVSKWQ